MDWGGRVESERFKFPLVAPTSRGLYARGRGCGDPLGGSGSVGVGATLPQAPVEASRGHIQVLVTRIHAIVQGRPLCSASSGMSGGQNVSSLSAVRLMAI